MHILIQKHRNVAASLLIVGLIITTACAKIADPLPPLIRVPIPANDLSVYQTADSIVLTVTKPTSNTDGSPASTLEYFQILCLREDAKASGRALDLSDDAFIEDSESVLMIPSSDFSNYLDGGTFVIRDPLTPSMRSALFSSYFHYAVLFINKRRQAAGLSNRASIAPMPIPLAPKSLKIEVTENSINLKWAEPSENMDGSVPARIAGYNIYRSVDRDEFSDSPINSEPVKEGQYKDRNFEFDTNYFYRISTVGSARNPLAQSYPSKAYSVITRDIFPPAPPENFNAVPEGGAVILLWAPSSSEDVAGYNLYRAEEGKTMLPLVQNAPAADLSFRDSGVESGRAYEYIIIAVDAHGNKSTEARAKLRLP
jgi:hypothetical protein